MRHMGRAFWLTLGLAFGVAATFWFRPAPQPVWAANDRHDDYIMCTGPVRFGVNVTADGIWLLDYRAGKLLGTVVDPLQGKIVGWAEVDLVKEFNIPPKQNVHFMMTTGSPTNGNYGAAYPGGPLPGKLGGKGGAGPGAAPGGLAQGGNPGAQGVGFAGGASGNTPLYLTEINTGQLRVYTMAPRLDGTGRMEIFRHDATLFRAPPPP